MKNHAKDFKDATSRLRERNQQEVDQLDNIINQLLGALAALSLGEFWHHPGPLQQLVKMVSKVRADTDLDFSNPLIN